MGIIGALLEHTSVYNGVLLHVFLGWLQYTHYREESSPVNQTCILSTSWKEYPFGQIPVTFCMNCFNCTWTCMFICDMCVHINDEHR